MVDAGRAEPVDEPRCAPNSVLVVVGGHFGVAIVCSGEGKLPGSVAYTAGLAARSRVELAVTGLPLQEAVAVLADLVSRVTEGLRLASGSWVAGPPGWPWLRLIGVKAPEVHLPVAVRVNHDRPFAALQAVWADPRRRYPWDPGYPTVELPQQLLGPRDDR
jgi:hypothetical protein